MTPTLPARVMPSRLASDQTPRCTFILHDGTKVMLTYCPEADIDSIHEHLPNPKYPTIVLAAIDGPGVFLLSLKNLNPIEPAERLPA